MALRTNKHLQIPLESHGNMYQKSATNNDIDNYDCLLITVLSCRVAVAVSRNALPVKLSEEIPRN